MKQTKTRPTIRSRRAFVYQLTIGPVHHLAVSKGLARVVALWLDRGELVQVGNFYKLA